MSGERALRQLQKAKEKLQRGGGGGGAEEAALCNQLGELLASHGRYAEALEEHRRELRLLEAAGDGLGCAVAHRKIGERLAELGSYQAALEHQRRHLELARALGDAAEQQRAWATIGRTHMFVAESRGGGGGGGGEEEEEGEEVTAALREAEGAFRTSLAIVEEKLEGAVPRRELAAMRTRLYLNLGLVYDSLRDAGRRGRYLQRSVFVAERARLDEDLQRAYFNLGAIHLRQGQHPQALRCLQRARDCARRMQDKALESECCSSTAQVQLSLGDFAAAKRSLRTAYALGSRQPHQRHLVRCNLRYATKVTRLQEALEEAAGEPAAAMALCERLGDVFSRHGDFRRALEHYQRQLSYAEALGRPAPELAAIHVSLATTFGDLQEPARAEHHYRQELALHRGDALEEGRTWLSIALAKEEAGEPRAELEACLGTALERAEAAGELRLQRQVLRHLHALQQRAGSAEAADTMARLRGLPGGEEEEEEEEEEQEGSEAPEEESDLELSESEGEDDELDGYTKSVPGRRRICKWNRRNDRGETPLHRACIEGDLRRVQLYLKQGHPLNPRDYCGWTPLHEACNHGHLEIVRLLLDRGAAVDDAGGPGCEGITPLHDALGCGHFEVAELLVQRGASLAARNAKGLTPLGTLEEWIGLYGKELDQETWQRCRATERLLKETAAAGGAPAAPRDSQLFDAELSEPLIAGGEDAAGAQAEPGDPDTSPPAMSPLRPARKRPRGAEAAAPDPAAPAGGQAEYEAAIRSLGSARSLPVPVPVPVPTASPRPALIPAEEYVEDWLEDDLAAAAARGARKRSRREPGDGAGEPGAARRRQNRPVGRAAPGRGRERPESPGSPARAAEGSAEAGGEEAQPPPGPALPPPIRVRVRVQDNVFLIPVPQSDGRAVGWLAAQAAERYYQACGLLPRLTLTKEGALLAPQDLVGDVLQSNEEVSPARPPAGAGRGAVLGPAAPGRALPQGVPEPGPGAAATAAEGDGAAGAEPRVQRRGPGPAPPPAPAAAAGAEAAGAPAAAAPGGLRAGRRARRRAQRRAQHPARPRPPRPLRQPARRPGAAAPRRARRRFPEPGGAGPEPEPAGRRRLPAAGAAAARLPRAHRAAPARLRLRRRLLPALPPRAERRPGRSVAAAGAGAVLQRVGRSGAGAAPAQPPRRHARAPGHRLRGGAGAPAPRRRRRQLPGAGRLRAHAPRAARERLGRRGRRRGGQAPPRLPLPGLAGPLGQPRHQRRGPADAAVGAGRAEPGAAVPQPGRLLRGGAPGRHHLGQGGRRRAGPAALRPRREPARPAGRGAGLARAPRHRPLRRRAPPQALLHQPLSARRHRPRSRDVAIRGRRDTGTSRYGDVAIRGRRDTGTSGLGAATVCVGTWPPHPAACWRPWDEDQVPLSLLCTRSPPPPCHPQEVAPRDSATRTRARLGAAALAGGFSLAEDITWYLSAGPWLLFGVTPGWGVPGPLGHVTFPWDAGEGRGLAEGFIARPRLQQRRRRGPPQRFGAAAPP